MRLGTTVKPSFGWTLLSKDALKRAEKQLREDVEGVRDEVGFLGLHQAYADRFFPGTSVLHTRLRYALFVPWLYQRLIERAERHRIDELLEREERTLVGRLKQSGELGVIGSRSYPKPTTQPPSLVYWTALGTWRILKPLPAGTCPPRATVHRALALMSAGHRLHDDDRQPLDDATQIFTVLPAPPTGWNDSRLPLNFSLEPAEKRFLRGCLLTVHRPGTTGIPSLLSRLVDVPLTTSADLYGAKVTGAADPEDRAALRRAGQAAALSAVGRAVYAGLVEWMQHRFDGALKSTHHRDMLPGVIATYGDDALALDVEAVEADAPGRITNGILSVLAQTQAWLRRPGRNVEDLHAVYEQAEFCRKGRRSRLTKTPAGRERRAEWIPEEHPDATPLHYRWGNVRRLLMDLQGPS